MTERAALYTLAVRARGGATRPLDDIDGNGTRLADTLRSILGDFSEASPDGSSVVRVLLVEPDGDDLLAVLQHGQNGVAADIVDASGGVKLQLTPDELQLVRYGCLFRLPVGASAGSLAVHVSNGRGIKGLVAQGLAARFASAFPGLRLSIEPLADPTELRDAVKADRIETLRLVRLEPAGEHPPDEAGKWVDSASAARLELDVAVTTPGHRIERALIERHLAGDAAAFAEIVSFAGMTFDSAFVGVVLADETRRLFDLAQPDAGRPVVAELPPFTLDELGEPTAASLLAALRAALGAASARVF